MRILLKQVIVGLEIFAIIIASFGEPLNGWTLAHVGMKLLECVICKFLSLEQRNVGEEPCEFLGKEINLKSEILFSKVHKLCCYEQKFTPCQIR